MAEVTLTPLSNNTPADADDVMGNFNALNEALPPSDCATDQIIKWDDTNDVWVCADMPSVNGSEPANRYKWEYVGKTKPSGVPAITMKSNGEEYILWKLTK